MVGVDRRLRYGWLLDCVGCRKVAGELIHRVVTDPSPAWHVMFFSAAHRIPL
jgi:hypothetical protein